MHNFYNIHKIQPDAIFKTNIIAITVYHSLAAKSFRNKNCLVNLIRIICFRGNVAGFVTKQRMINKAIYIWFQPI